jgi:hypothetical protein
MKPKIILLLTLLFSACTTAPAPTPTPSPTQTVPPTNTATPLQPTATSTQSPTLTSTPTITSTPTQTPTLSPTPTETFLPTLSPEEEHELFNTNGGCQFPCWWGIIPGQTRFKDIFKILRFSKNVTRYRGKDNQFYYWISFDVPETIKSNGFFEFQLLVHEEIIQSYYSQYDWRSELDYSLSGMLNIHGPPAEVWLNATPIMMDDQPRYTYVLFYPEQGIMTAREFFAEIKDGVLEMCPNDYVNTPSFLWLWSPTSEMSFFDNADGKLINFYPGSNIEYFLLEDVTNMNVETFYITYLDPDTDECILSPVNIWP